MKRDIVIKVLVTRDERDALQKAADKDKVKLSTFIRSRLFKTTSIVKVVGTVKVFGAPRR